MEASCCLCKKWEKSNKKMIKERKHQSGMTKIVPIFFFFYEIKFFICSTMSKERDSKRWHCDMFFHSRDHWTFPLQCEKKKLFQFAHL